MSFWLDLRILFETVKIVLTGGRSAGGGDRRLAARLGRAA